ALPLMLVVDDERGNRLLLKRLFEREFQVICVENGEDALDMLLQAPFDLVLLDVMMPIMSGLELLQRMRSKPALAEIPVILVTALAESRFIIEGLQMGANDYVTKPLETDVLRARVQTQLTMKRLMDERKEHILQLEAAQAFKDRCFQMASHDLKGPLGNLRMAHSLMRTAMADDPRLNDVMDMAELTVKNMRVVIEEFLDLAALQNGKIEVRMSEVRVDEAIRELVSQYRLTATEKDIALDSLPSSVSICADKARFSQVLGNLISNALKYSPSQTTITLWAETADNRVRICVADQGPGIPAEERSRLFTQFGKLSTRPTMGESSTGLGLWIVKHLVQLQGGNVGVECPPEGGSIFWIEFPAA
ncbi:MAG: hybrid sensor histidine kinase/response regulator, partial [Acidobacteriales bacterium]|nr:hybrid sensor histidine kinase/response regulator [Terriglobales bacterium]